MTHVYQHTLPAGTRIENYAISGVLGVGGFGITYRAHDAQLDCDVAIKEYLPADIAVRNADGLSVSVKAANDSTGYEHGLKRFLDEARTLALFREPNIVRVTRYLEAHGTAYFVMDYEEGEPLSQRLLRAMSLDERACLQIALPLLRGLRAVHARNFLHRDIKPSNIYLRHDNTPVLIDFGAAREAFGAINSHITGMVTHGYAPFEQYSPNARLGPWTDLYALGATLYHCATGVPPPAAPERVSAIQDGTEDVVQKVCSQLGRRFSAEFLDMLRRMLAPQASQRPQSTEEVQQVFESLLTGLPSGATATSSAMRTTMRVDPDNMAGNHWKPEVLHAIEVTLEQYVGPLASILVRKLSGATRSIEQISEELSRYIPSNTKRQEFLRISREVITTGALPPSESRPAPPAPVAPASISTPTPGLSLEAETLVRIEQALAAQLGPMARVLVKKALSEVDNLDALYQRLATELSDEHQRHEFLASRHHH